MTDYKMLKLQSICDAVRKLV